MHVIGKIWGATCPILQTPIIEIHRLDISPNSRCSVHCHKTKWNGFFVERGTLLINVRKNSYDLTDVTTLGPRMFTAVKPGEFHWFETKDEPVQCLEVYWPEMLSEDIIRETVGGTTK